MAVAIAVLAIRGTLFWLLSSAAVEKVQNVGRFERLLAERLPWQPPAIRLCTRGLIVAEFGIAFGLLAPYTWPIFALAAMLLFAIFAAVIVTWRRSGRTGACGCGGLLPLRRISHAHAIALATIAFVAGFAGVVGVHSWLSDPLPKAAMPATLLVLFAPLPLLLILTAIYDVLRLRRRTEGQYPRISSSPYRS